MRLRRVRDGEVRGAGNYAGLMKTEVLSGAVVVPVKNPRVKLPEKGLLSRGEHHVTLMTPLEGEELSSEMGWSPEEFEAHMTGRSIRGTPTYVGLGVQENGHNAVYFIVVQWKAAQMWRAKMGLDPKDLHVTLGFREEDIHEVPKGHETIIRKLRQKK